MSMISDATKILVVTTQFSLAKIPERLWRAFRQAYNPWIEPSRKLPRDGEAVECRFGRGSEQPTIAWCFPRRSAARETAAIWYVIGPTGETKLEAIPLLWRRAPRDRQVAGQVRPAC